MTPGFPALLISVLTAAASGAVVVAQEPTASIYASNEGPLLRPGEQAVELLRFVTAYRTGLEAVVDVTPFAPLLQHAADSNGLITFYLFIDTWVDNSTGRDILYLNNVSGYCSARKKSEGNGWLASLDLVTWPAVDRTKDTRPLESVTLASGMFGAHYPFGRISVYEGRLADQGKAVVLDEAADLASAATSPLTYSCPSGAAEVFNAGLLGYAAREAQLLSRAADVASAEDRLKMRKVIEDDLVQTVVYPQLFQVAVKDVFPHNSSIKGTFDPAKAQVVPGTPVFYNSVDVVTDTPLDGFWYNASYPFESVGQVKEVYNSTLLLQLKYPCVPILNGTLPRLLVPSTAQALDIAKATVNAAMRFGEQAAASPRDEASADEWLRPLLLQEASGKSANVTPSKLTQLLRFGQVDVSAAGGGISAIPGVALEGGPAEAGKTKVEGDAASTSRACVVLQQRQGRLFQRWFNLSTLTAGGRAVMQLTVTGHGWAATSLQCGEYCYAIYQLSFNGRRAMNVTEFRDDCRKNPIDGAVQRGTWYESRNGWCPGTVEPGLFVDVTPFVHAGSNHLEFEVSVWTNRTGRYEPYSDYSGFALGDQAFLTVGMSLFVYDAAAVAAIQRLPRAYTAAEAAVRHGSSSPRALQPAVSRPPLEDEVLLQSSGSVHVVAGKFARKQGFVRSGKFWDKNQHLKHRGDGRKALSLDMQSDQLGRLDFEARAPWYLYNQTAEGRPGASSGGTPASIFKEALLQGSSRVVRATISKEALAAGWSQGALHLRLEKPPGQLDFDHWDREASLGLIIQESSETVKVHKAKPAPVRKQWPLRK